MARYARPIRELPLAQQFKPPLLPGEEIRIRSAHVLVGDATISKVTDPVVLDIIARHLSEKVRIRVFNNLSTRVETRISLAEEWDAPSRSERIADAVYANSMTNPYAPHEQRPDRILDEYDDPGDPERTTDKHVQAGFNGAKARMHVTTPSNLSGLMIRLQGSEPRAQANSGIPKKRRGT